MSQAPPVSPDGLWFWTGSAWESLLSADGTKRWDGQAWQLIGISSIPSAVPASAPAQVTLAQPGAAVRPTNWWLIGGLGAVGAMVALVALSALAVNVLHITAKVTNASTAADFVNEQRYNDVYQRDLTTIQTAAVPFAATATTPGVCGKGGTKQGCFDTGEKVIVDLRAMLTDLSRVSVPPRYLKADADLRKGLQLDIDALTLRDQAIATKDPNASFDASNQKGQQADALLHQAYGEFPADNAPKPPL